MPVVESVGFAIAAATGWELSASAVIATIAGAAAAIGMQMSLRDFSPAVAFSYAIEDFRAFTAPPHPDQPWTWFQVERPASATITIVSVDPVSIDTTIALPTAAPTQMRPTSKLHREWIHLFGSTPWPPTPPAASTPAAASPAPSLPPGASSAASAATPPPQANVQPWWEPASHVWALMALWLVAKLAFHGGTALVGVAVAIDTLVVVCALVAIIFIASTRPGNASLWRRLKDGSDRVQIHYYKWVGVRERVASFACVRSKLLELCGEVVGNMWACVSYGVIVSLQLLGLPFRLVGSVVYALAVPPRLVRYMSLEEMPTADAHMAVARLTAMVAGATRSINSPNVTAASLNTETAILMECFAARGRMSLGIGDRPKRLSVIGHDKAEQQYVLYKLRKDLAKELPRWRVAIKTEDVLKFAKMAEDIMSMATPATAAFGLRLVNKLGRLSPAVMCTAVALGSVGISEEKLFTDYDGETSGDECDDATGANAGGLGFDVEHARNRLRAARGQPGDLNGTSTATQPLHVVNNNHINVALAGNGQAAVAGPSAHADATNYNSEQSSASAAPPVRSGSASRAHTPVKTREAPSTQSSRQPSRSQTPMRERADPQSGTSTTTVAPSSAVGIDGRGLSPREMAAVREIRKTEQQQAQQSGVSVPSATCGNDSDSNKNNSGSSSGKKGMAPAPDDICVDLNALHGTSSAGTGFTLGTRPVIGKPDSCAQTSATLAFHFVACAFPHLGGTSIARFRGEASTAQSGVATLCKMLGIPDCGPANAEAITHQALWSLTAGDNSSTRVGELVGMSNMLLPQRRQIAALIYTAPRPDRPGHWTVAEPLSPAQAMLNVTALRWRLCEGGAEVDTLVGDYIVYVWRAAHADERNGEGWRKCSCCSKKKSEHGPSAQAHKCSNTICPAMCYGSCLPTSGDTAWQTCDGKLFCNICKSLPDYVPPAPRRAQAAAPAPAPAALSPTAATAAPPLARAAPAASATPTAPSPATAAAQTSVKIESRKRSKNNSTPVSKTAPASSAGAAPASSSSSQLFASSSTPALTAAAEHAAVEEDRKVFKPNAIAAINSLPAAQQCIFRRADGTFAWQTRQNPAPPPLDPSADPTSRLAGPSGMALTGADFAKVTLIGKMAESRCSQIAIMGLSPAVRVMHLQALLQFKDFIQQHPATQHLPLPRLVLRFLRHKLLHARKWWQPQTFQRNLLNLLAALAWLPIYSNASHTISLRSDAEVSATLKAVALKAAEAQPTHQAAASWASIQKAIEEEPLSHIKVAILLQWLTASRCGDVLGLTLGDISLNQNLLDVTFSKGKGVLLRKGKYTVHTVVPTESLPLLTSHLAQVKRLQLKPQQKRSETEIFFSTNAIAENKRVQLMNRALKRADSKLSTRAIRRGALQAMALGTADLPPVPLDTLMSYAGHTRPETTRRYLDWSRLFGAGAQQERQAAAALAASAAPSL